MARKAPKKPKTNSLKAWENYDKRYKQFHSDKKKLETIKKKYGR